MAEKIRFHSEWIPPREPGSMRGRELQALWLEQQVSRLPLTQKERLLMERELAQAWDAWKIHPKDIKAWIDSEVAVIDND